ncbi:hypothetical protein NliqN6_6591 [Naganishia liquefaciens]|uniref:Uncharacterized protein n=1 Tax=Naganishia liquefaciens TaxID=104408 RepID=A0A8H3YHR7_9TREE|nr:hypothetical protein NliqN6_6591 [Naganishia liquefaciens]
MKLTQIASLLSVASVTLSPLVNAFSGGYWPVSTPSVDEPWVLGQPNAVVFGMGGDIGITEFDIQLHNFNKTIMVGFLPIAQNVPVKKWTSGSKKGQYGGSIGVDLPDGMATGEGFSLVFMDTKSGNVFYKTNKFPIYAANAQPNNFTSAELPSGAPATTAVLTQMPNPTQEWGVTMGAARVTATVANQAGQAGSGSS